MWLVSWTLACSKGLSPGESGTVRDDSGTRVDSTPGDSTATDTSGDTHDSAPPPLDCLPAFQQIDPWVEGVAIAAPIVCSTGRSTTDFDWSVVEVPVGATLDRGPTLDWTPGLSDAGPHRVIVSLEAKDGRTPVEVGALDLWIADAWDTPSNVPIDPTTYTQEFGLPVLDIRADTDPGYDKEYVASTTFYAGATLPSEVKYHGAASLYYPKHGLTLRFPDDGQIDLDKEGLGDKRHLVLISTFDDNSYVRNKMAFDVWQDIADYWGRDRVTPHSFFVVVYWNDAYLGLYVAVDRPDDELMRQRGLNPDGNLYKAYSHDANYYRTNASGHTKGTLHDGFEKKEGVPDDYSDLEALTAFSADHSDAEFMAAADSWIRVDEFMDWFLFVHHIAAGDSAGKNAYLYDDPSLPTEFRYCPWDFNHSFGQDWMTLRVPSDSYDDFKWNNGIFAHFEDDPAAASELWSRYTELLAGPLSAEAFQTRVDGYEAEIGPSAERDWSKWSNAYRHYGGWDGSRPGDWTTYDEETTYLRDWLDDRARWGVTAH